MWITYGNPSSYTVHYCPQCKKQRVWNSIARDLFKCSACGLKMRYKRNLDRMVLEWVYLCENAINVVNFAMVFIVKRVIIQSDME